MGEHRNVGTSNGQSKLNEEQVLLALYLLEQGNSQRKVAKILHVSVTTINNIKHGYLWNHVTHIV